MKTKSDTGNGDRDRYRHTDRHNEVGRETHRKRYIETDKDRDRNAQSENRQRNIQRERKNGNVWM